MQEVIMSTDQAYWQVISLVNKKKLAEGYLKLLQQLDSDVEKMINQGVATKADGLSVRVKVNEAEMTLTKVEDGLSLARMLLCQLCGIDSEFSHHTGRRKYGRHSITDNGPSFRSIHRL